MIFTDPIAGEKHGYYDGWMPDGLFHYSGEGQYGDQRMLSGNASILNHRAEGRALRVFKEPAASSPTSASSRWTAGTKPMRRRPATAPSAR